MIWLLLPRLDVQNAPLTGARESRSSAAARRAETLGETPRLSNLDRGLWVLLLKVLLRGADQRDKFEDSLAWASNTETQNRLRV